MCTAESLDRRRRNVRRRRRLPRNLIHALPVGKCVFPFILRCVKYCTWDKRGRQSVFRCNGISETSMANGFPDLLEIRIIAYDIYGIWSKPGVPKLVFSHERPYSFLKESYHSV
jgi:hypothetical protein